MQGNLHYSRNNNSTESFQLLNTPLYGHANTTDTLTHTHTHTHTLTHTLSHFLSRSPQMSLLSHHASSSHSIYLSPSLSLPLPLSFYLSLSLSLPQNQNAMHS